MSQSCNWVFTLNNPKDEFYRTDGIRYITYQLELGENGTTHVQGYIIFTNRRRLKGVQDTIQKAHWEIRRGSHEEARDYCGKGSTKLTPTFMWGEEPRPGKRNDLERCKQILDEGKSMAELADECFAPFVKYYRGFERYKLIKFKHEDSEPRVSIIYGPTGTGKTKYCNEKYPKAYWNFGTKWFDGYEQEREVIFDEFYGNLPYSMVLRLCDRYPYSVETKGGVTPWNAKIVIFTTNKEPSKWYDGVRMNFAPLARRVKEWVYMPVLGETYIYNTYEEFFNKIFNLYC